MKLLCLLLVGVVGWAVGGVDWSREVVGQDALIDVPPSTIQPTVSDAPPPATSRAGPYAKNKTASLRRGSSLDFTPTRQAASQPHLVGRFQASAYGSPSGHGCYIINTMTGRTWHVANGQPPQVVAEELTQQSHTGPAAGPTPTYTEPPTLAPSPSTHPEPAPMPRTTPPSFSEPTITEPQAPEAD